MNSQVIREIIVRWVNIRWYGEIVIALHSSKSSHIVSKNVRYHYNHFNLSNTMITVVIRLGYDYETTMIRLRRIARAFFHSRRAKKMNMSIFRRSRIVVESQLWYRLFFGKFDPLMETFLECETMCCDHTWTRVRGKFGGNRSKEVAEVVRRSRHKKTTPLLRPIFSRSLRDP